ncbi:hypothetical protein [Robertkochia flava]|uniref:hypothetical protein n=1 Tax=Robertkochia flava TaxID=3447986 RepID=UPI001CC97A8E|nr:hypothetical protein [Robertkochia marina]
MKHLLLICLLLILSQHEVRACQCDVPKKALEFIMAPDVFLAKAVSKNYTEDKQQYTIRFEVIRHFKKEPHKKYYEFTLASEGEYTGAFDSCDWNVEVGEVWVIYTYFREEALRFGYNCSNSRPIGDITGHLEEDRLTAGFENFDLSDFILSAPLDGRFEPSQPEMDIDSLLSTYYQKNYGESYAENIAYVVADIDTTGTVLGITYWDPQDKSPQLNLDLLYGLNRYHPIEEKEPRTEFGRDVIRELKKIETWDPVCIEGTSIPVRYRNFMQFHKKKDSIIAHYRIR